MKTYSICLLIAVSSATAARGTTIAVFEPIPDALSANDMSSDGRYVVGQTDFDQDYFPDGTYHYDTHTGVMTILPPEATDAAAVSDDGTVVLGTIVDPESPDPALGETAALWTAETGWQSLGYLPNAGECPSRSNGYELSGDGSVAVGLSWDGCFGRGFRWTAATGMQQLEVLALDRNRASVCSADGNLIGGFAQGNQARTPTFWTGDLQGETLDPVYDARGEVFGINDAGTIMLGTYGTNTDPTDRAAKWTLGESGWQRETIGAGSLGPAILWRGIPMDITDDGTIVGFDTYLGNRIAWIIPQGTPPYLNFKTYVQSLGATVPIGWTLDVCQAISTSGRRIIGHGGAARAWTVTIDLLGDMNCDGAVDVDDIEPFTQALIDVPAYDTAFPACWSGRADMNQDDSIDGLDVGDFVSDLLGS